MRLYTQAVYWESHSQSLAKDLQGYYDVVDVRSYPDVLDDAQVRECDVTCALIARTFAWSHRCFNIVTLRTTPDGIARAPVFLSRAQNHSTSMSFQEYANRPVATCFILFINITLCAIKRFPYADPAILNFCLLPN